MTLLLACWGNDSTITVRKWGGVALELEREGREEVSGRISFQFLQLGQGNRGVRRGKEFDLCPGRGEESTVWKERTDPVSTQGSVS